MRKLFGATLDREGRGLRVVVFMVVCFSSRRRGRFLVKDLTELFESGPTRNSSDKFR